MDENKDKSKKVNKLSEITQDLMKSGFKYGMLIVSDKKMENVWSVGFLDRGALEDWGLNLNDFKAELKGRIKSSMSDGLGQLDSLVDAYKRSQEEDKEKPSHKELIKSELEKAIKRAGINLKGHTIDELVEFGEENGFFDADGNVIKSKVNEYKKYMLKKYMLKKLLMSAFEENKEEIEALLNADEDDDEDEED